MKGLLALSFLISSLSAFSASDRVVCSTDLDTPDYRLNSKIEEIAKAEQNQQLDLNKKVEYEITGITSTGAGRQAGGFLTCVTIKQKK